MGKVIILTGWLLLIAGVATAGTCLEGDCRNGSGTFQWDDGSKFTGNFVNSAPEGVGIYTDPNGRAYTVTYKDGHPISRPKRPHPRRSDHFRFPDFGNQ